MQIKPGFVCLKKAVTAMIALKSSLIIEGDLLNFRTRSSDPNSEPLSTATNTTTASKYSWLSKNSLIDKRTGNNVLVVRQIKNSDILEFYKNIYLVGMFGRGIIG